MTAADPVANVGALAEPVVRVGRGWTSALSLANGAIWVGWYGPLQILLASQAEDFAPGTGMSKETMLAWVTGAGAVVSLFANPFFGALSDRTTARWGRRTPWIVAGATGGALSLLLLAGAGGVWTMAAGWCLVQLTLNAAFAAITAAVPDRVPRLQRGSVGGWLGAAQILGVVGGTGLATAAGVWAAATRRARCSRWWAYCRTYCATRICGCRPRPGPPGPGARSRPPSG